MMSRSACLICGNESDNRVWSAREMMYGLRDRFDYAECAVCGCLTLVNPPEDVARYYPDQYYAHAPPRRESALKRRLWRVWIAQAIGEDSWLGRVLIWHFGPPRFAPWLRIAGVARDAAILDVGCGTGWLLRHLSAAGWRRLAGIDPFLAGDVEWSDGVTLRKRSLEAVTGRYDFIMANHSFEHMADPATAMGHMVRLLAPGGKILIRLPVADSVAWQTYRTDWINLDAPRHHFIPTRDGMERLGRQAGLHLDRVWHDSRGGQFWLSEQYRRDIPLVEAYRVDPRDGCLGSRADQLRDNARARALNEAGTGDCACFVFTRARED